MLTLRKLDLVEITFQVRVSLKRRKVVLILYRLFGVFPVQRTPLAPRESPRDSQRRASYA